MSTPTESSGAPALRLEPVTPKNIDAALELKVRPDQEHLVAPVATSLAEAYAYGETAWPRLVYDGERLVGFVMAFFDVVLAPGEPPRSGLWRLNIAAGVQGRGYGRFAVEQVAAEVRRRGRTRVCVTYVPGEGGPAGFYARLGFRPTGEVSGGEDVAELAL
ncbi:GNAT family N-acetyltransferase [Kitasatospora sp. NPDC059463]|uniref:GNAT family N-acetyltransferase n=1 Tax=unclassified Kitasatospora TaxID=2633591 RepID=UPI0036C61E3F